MASLLYFICIVFDFRLHTKNKDDNKMPKVESILSKLPSVPDVSQQLASGEDKKSNLLI